MAKLRSSLHPDLDHVLERARSVLADYYHCEENETLEAIEMLQLIRRPFSTVVIMNARTSKNVRELVMKSTVHHPVNEAIIRDENQAVLEYNVLKHLHPRFENVENCSVPRPLLVIPELETYIMEFVDGELLVDEHRYTRYFSSYDRFRLLNKNYFLMGRWLKQFQMFTGIQNANREALLGVMERCEHRLKLIAESNDPRIPKGLREKVMGLLQKHWSQLPDEHIGVSGRHGDFGPWNILAGPRGITVIDFLGYKVDPLPVDLLKVLVYLDNERRSLTSSGRRVDALKESFLAGYGKLPETPYSVVVICEAMQRIVSIWGMISAPRREFHHRIEATRCIQAQTSWLMDGRSNLLWFS